MEITIRSMMEQDRQEVLQMMRVFYASDAVQSNGSEEIFEKDICNCVEENPYMKPESRGFGIGSHFFRYIKEKYPDAVLRLEVEPENERAIHVYKKAGYEVLPYMEMIQK